MSFNSVAFPGLNSDCIFIISLMLLLHRISVTALAVLKHFRYCLMMNLSLIIPNLSKKILHLFQPYYLYVVNYIFLTGDYIIVIRL